MRQTLRSIILLSVLGMLVAGVSASAASAAEPIKFEWKAAGSPLASGSSREFTLKDKGTGLFHLQGSIGGASLKISSNKLKVTKGSKILGGKPGTASEILELEGVKVESPADCTVENEKITMEELKSEIVESSKEEKGQGKAELLLAPFVGTRWAEFTLGGASCEFPITVAPAGSLLVELSPQKVEEKVGQLIFEAKLKEYRNSKNEFKKAGLTFAGNPATLTGEAEMELVSKEAFGAF
jgi:hypothetical protein